MIQVNRIYLIFNPVHFLVDSSDIFHISHSISHSYQMKTNKSTAPKSTELTDATKSDVLTLNHDFNMKSDSSINSTSAVNSDTTVNRTTPANADNLFDNE